jgi:predicted ATP-dependent endonuclease of OLD family
MERAYIDWVRVENFRCVRQADIHLTPLHALIGPNDAGKSSLPHAIATARTHLGRALRGR